MAPNLSLFLSHPLANSECLALKHESRILGHSSNPVCGFSMMEQVRLCAVWPVENWLGSSWHQIQGWTTVRESFSCASEQGPLLAIHPLCGRGSPPRTHARPVLELISGLILTLGPSRRVGRDKEPTVTQAPTFIPSAAKIPRGGRPPRFECLPGSNNSQTDDKVAINPYFMSASLCYVQIQVSGYIRYKCSRYYSAKR